MGERQTTSRGPFAVTESDCKHAPCRLRINAVGDDRRFVALAASGSDDFHELMSKRDAALPLRVRDRQSATIVPYRTETVGRFTNAVVQALALAWDETRNPRGGADRIDPTLLRFVQSAMTR